MSLVAAELLGDGALPPEETVAALYRLGITFPDRDDHHFAYPLHQHLHGRVAVAADVLNACPLLIGVREAFYRAVVPHPEENLSACGVRHDHQFTGEGGGKVSAAFTPPTVARR